MKAALGFCTGEPVQEGALGTPETGEQAPWHDELLLPPASRREEAEEQAEVRGFGREEAAEAALGAGDGEEGTSVGALASRPLGEGWEGEWGAGGGSGADGGEAAGRAGGEAGGGVWG